MIYNLKIEMRTNALFFLYFICVTNQMSTDFLHRAKPIARKLAGPNAYKISFYHEIRKQLFISLKNYLTRVNDNKELDEAGLAELTAFVKENIKETAEKEYDYKIHDKEIPNNEERIADHEEIKLLLHTKTFGTIVDIHIDPDLAIQEVIDTVADDNKEDAGLENKEEDSEKKDGEGDKKEESKLKKQELKIILKNGIIESTMKLFYANHINDAIKEFINLNVWKFMEKTRQVIFNLDGLSKDIKNLLILNFHSFKKVSNPFNGDGTNVDEIDYIKEYNEKNVEISSDIDKNFKDVKGEEQFERDPLAFDNLSPIQYGVQMEVIEFEKGAERKLKIDPEAEPFFKKNVEDFLAKNEGKYKVNDKIYLYILTPLIATLDPIYITVIKVDAPHTEKPVDPEAEKKDDGVEDLKLNQKLIVKVDSSYFSFVHEYNILTDRFVLKNFERLIKKIRDEILIYLEALETFKSGDLDFDELSKILAGGPEHGEELQKLLLVAGKETLQQTKVLYEFEEDKKDKEEFKIIVTITEGGDKEEPRVFKIEKCFPRKSQYNTALFLKSFLNFYKDVNYYLIEFDEKDEKLVQNNRLYKDMSNPFLSSNETIKPLGPKTSEIIIGDEKEVLKDLKLVVYGDEHYNTMDYGLKTGGKQQDTFLVDFTIATSGGEVGEVIPDNAPEEKNDD